mmetsp:Transcript_124404/g.346339  ORF Transcript_124404/g.346339 Transcript_124404/m.346339 type:complete len:206 (+) Transcript_124404:1410-2027(+)
MIEAYFSAERQHAFSLWALRGVADLGALPASGASAAFLETSGRKPQQGKTSMVFTESHHPMPLLGVRTRGRFKLLRIVWRLIRAVWKTRAETRTMPAMVKEASQRREKFHLLCCIGSKMHTAMTVESVCINDLTTVSKRLVTSAASQPWPAVTKTSKEFVRVQLPSHPSCALPEPLTRNPQGDTETIHTQPQISTEEKSRWTFMT